MSTSTEWTIHGSNTAQHKAGHTVCRRKGQFYLLVMKPKADKLEVAQEVRLKSVTRDGAIREASGKL